MGQFVELKGNYLNVVNFAMQQNHIPIIHGLQVQNKTKNSLHNISIKIQAKPEFAKPLELHIDSLAPKQAIEMDPEKLKLHLDAVYLMSLTERFAGELTIEVFVDGELDEHYVHEINILAYNEWSGPSIAPEIISSFVTPNHPLVAQVLHRASEKMKEWCGDSSLCAYQRQNENHVLQQMAAIFAALEEQKIAYCVPPARFEAVGQKVRLCDDIMAQKLGTCLDLSLLYASCLEQAGLYPILIFIKGHAFAGSWLVPETFTSPCQDDFSMLSKRFDPSVGEIAVVECTMFAGSTENDFDLAREKAENYFLEPENFHYFVDVKRARNQGIRPIPQRKYDEQGNMIPLKETDQDTTNWGAPKEIDVVEKENTEGPVKHSKQRIWQNKLLNLSIRNSLLNFRPTGNVLQLICNDLCTLEDALAAGDEFRILDFFTDVEKESDDEHFVFIKKDRDNDELLKTEFEHRRLRTFLSENETNRRIINLYRSAKVSLEENGSNTLYLALGFLKWFETDMSEKPRYAPLVLLPLEIVRKSARQGYVIRSRDEETQFNITLLEKLRAEFDIRIAGLDPLPTDDSGVDLKKIFAKVRHAVMHKKRWDVVEHAFIGQFSFSQYIMWNDIGERMQEIEQNPIVNGLIQGALQKEFPSLISADTLDADFKPSDMAVPLSADSSQLAAICSAAKGCSFVLHGPPGTGKSQTITNIIANALFNGKSVLFIAEKMAALSVVQNRLEKIGLGPYCLELHSNKSSKSSITAQLEKSLNFARRKSPEEYQSEADNLHKLRQNLNSTMDKIHKVHKSGFSLYDAICEFEKYREFEGKLEIPYKCTYDATAEDIRHWREICEKLVVAAAECPNIQNHPLSDWGSIQYSENKRNQLVALLPELTELLEKFCGLYKQVEEQFCGFQIESAEKLRMLLQFGENLQGPDEIPLGLFSAVSPATDEKVRSICQCGRNFTELTQKILSEFEPEVFDIQALPLRNDWKESELKWFLPKFLGQRKVMLQVLRYAKSPKSIRKERLPQILNNLISCKQAKQTLAAESRELSALFGNFWAESKSNWDLLEQQYKAAGDATVCIKKLYNDPAKIKTMSASVAQLKNFKETHHNLLATVKNTFNAIENKWADLVQLVETSPSIPMGIGWPEQCLQKTNLWFRSLAQWRNWCSYLTCKKDATDSHLDCVIDALKKGTVDNSNLMSAFSCAVAYNLCIKYIDDDASLGSITGALLQLEIDRYKDTNKNFESLTRRELTARLSANIPSSTFASDSTEIGILKKCIANKCRNTSIRKLFDSIPNLLRRLTPCMLMSPISVAQYIDPSAPKFDLVIFDEASQLPTCEAVGAIARGDSLIIVGDPKQLPPTSFFKKDYTDEDNVEKEDLESILDDCLAISMPEMHLLWHYRSKDESLIAFSNYKYYDHQLYTFPSPNDLEGKVKFIPVEGFYDKSKTRQNKAEAEAIVAEIINRLKNPEERKKSIGIVTFSVVQQNLIEDLLEKEFANTPKLEEFAKESGEAIFIKNLESVQGDERDVIMFSVGYGPDAFGNVSMNFGPINNVGGERRLNVAVSRARQEMLVFSTLQPEQIDLGRTSSNGVAGLKDFLTFAKNGKKSLAILEKNHDEESVAEVDRFKKSIADELRKQGYKVEVDVGCSKYKLDVAIVHPEKPAEFILGILCDGETYRNSATAKDRNILQQSVLESLGWNITRLWSIEWFTSRENRHLVIQNLKNKINILLQEEKDEELRKALKAQRAAEDATNESTAESSEESDQNEEPIPEETAEVDEDIIVPATIESLFKEYQQASVTLPKRGSDFYDEVNSSLIRQQMVSIVEEESPISEEFFIARMSDLWNMKKTSKFLDCIKKNMRGLAFTRKKEGEKIFLWKDSKVGLVDFRIPSANVKRSMDDISVCEISSAIQLIVKEQKSIDEADLERLIAKVAGYTKCTAQMKEIIQKAIGYAVRNKIIVKKDSRISAV